MKHVKKFESESKLKHFTADQKPSPISAMQINTPNGTMNLEEIQESVPFMPCGPGHFYASRSAEIIDDAAPETLVITCERWRGMSVANEDRAEKQFADLVAWARSTGREVTAERNAGTGSIGHLDVVTIQ